MVFIVDSSGSVSSKDWKIAKDFVTKVVSQFDIGFKDTRVRVKHLSILVYFPFNAK